MAYTLSRIDRKARTYELSATVLAQAAEVPPDLTGVDVALLPKRSSPTAATVWYPAEYADGSFTVLLAGPDADSTGALVVPADADLWMRIADSPEVDAEKLERITVLGGGSLAGLPAVHVSSVAGLSGAPTADSLVDALEEPLVAAYGRAAPVLSNFSYESGTGNLLSYQEDGITITLTYNADGTVATSKRGSDPVQTYTYSGGNLAGVA